MSLNSLLIVFLFFALSVTAFIKYPDIVAYDAPIPLFQKGQVVKHKLTGHQVMVIWQSCKVKAKGCIYDVRGYSMNITRGVSEYELEFVGSGK